MTGYSGKLVRILALAAVAVVSAFGPLATATADPLDWRVGLAAAPITPEGQIRLSGYASRSEPSTGVLADLYAKAMALQDSDGHRALLITADVIGFPAPFAEAICKQIIEETGLKRHQILLNPSHTHTGPVTGMLESRGFGLSDEERETVRAYSTKLRNRLVDLAVAALADMKPARLSLGSGRAEFVMNRREKTDRGIRLGVNPEGYRDKTVPVLRVETPEGRLRAVVFGCACHNTTMTGKELRISGDYAGFAQEYIEDEHPGVQAMFMIGCAGDANPNPRGTAEIALEHGRALGGEVCRVLASELQPVSGPLAVELEWAEAPLAAVPSRELIEQMAAGPGYLAHNATRMLEALDAGTTLPESYPTPIAVWQFGDDLTLVALSGEVVSDYVRLVQSALGSKGLWIAGYSNDVFGYLPSKQVIADGGYETRGLFDKIGYFAPEAEDVTIATVRRLAEKAGRATSN